MPADGAHKDQRERTNIILQRLHAYRDDFKCCPKKLTASKALLRDVLKAQSAGDARLMCRLLIKCGAWLEQPKLASLGQDTPVNKSKKAKKVCVQGRVRKALLACLQGLDLEDSGTQRRSDVQAVLRHVRGILGKVSPNHTTSSKHWHAISQLSGCYILKGLRQEVENAMKVPSSNKTPLNVDPVSGMVLPEGFTRRVKDQVGKKSCTQQSLPTPAQSKGMPEIAAISANTDPVSGMVLPEGFTRRVKDQVGKKSCTQQSLPTPAQSKDMPETGTHSKAPPAVLPKFSFVTDAGDHAETPFEAYEDIEAVLAGLAAAFGKTREQLRIWDPFFCQGGMKLHLAKLGFTNVHNANEDFYKVIAKSDTIPAHDVLLTNPPFSKGHVDRILNFCICNRRPWMLLMPSYVHSEPHYAKKFSDSAPCDRPMYIKPWRRYAYLRPAGLSAGHQRATSISPFESLWYISLYEFRSKVMANYQHSKRRGCQLFQTQEGMLEATERAQVARTAHRPNPRARKRAAERINDMRRKRQSVM